VVVSTILFFLRKYICKYLSRKYHSDISCRTKGYYLSIIITLIFGWAAAEYKGALIDNELRKEILFHAENVADTINSERIEQLSFSIEDRKNPAFIRIRNQMIAYRGFIGDLRGIYSVTQKGGNIVFGPEDYDLSDPMASFPGKIYNFPDDEMIKSLKDGKKRVIGPVTDEYGTFISAYAPVFSKKTGDLLILIGVDILADDWKQSVLEARASSMLRTFVITLIFLAFSLMIGVRYHTKKSNMWLFRHLEALLVFILGIFLAFVFGYNAFLLAKISFENDYKKLAESKVALVRQDLFELRRDFEALSAVISNTNLNSATFNRISNSISRSQIVRSIQYADYIDGSLKLRYNYPEENNIIERTGIIASKAVKSAMDSAYSSGYMTISKPVEINDKSSIFQLSIIVTPVFSDLEKKITGFILTAIDLDMVASVNIPEFSSVDPTLSMKLRSIDGNNVPEIEKSEGKRFFPIFVFGITLIVEVDSKYTTRFKTMIIPGIATTFFISLLTILFSLFIVFLRNREVFLEIQVKNKTRELAESENDLMTTLYSIGDAVISTDESGMVRRMNKVATGLTGFTVEESAGCNVENIFRIHNATTGEKIPCPVDNVIANRKAVTLANDTTLVSKDGSERQIADSVAPIIDISGYLRGTVLVFHDVTEQYKIKKQLIDAKQDAEKASLAKSEFLANMSHEIRTPLNGIIGFSELLMRSKLDNVQSEYMSNISKSAKVLLDVVNDILDFSKIEAGKMELESENCNLHMILKESVELIRHKVMNKPVKLALTIEEKVPEQVVTDSLKLRQVVVNLLSNAAKFTEKGMIELKAAFVSYDEISGKFRIRISVTDTGIGIKPEQIEKLFRSFTQADPLTTRKYGGTGLGLAISSKILEKMGSNIIVKSKYQEGSVFLFDIDLVPGSIIDQSSRSTQNMESEVLFVSDTKYRILVAEDNEINMLLIKSVLKEIFPESEIFSAVNGEEAVNAYRENLPDIVFMDIQMPVMDGYTATEKIRYIEKELNRNVPVIALTAGVVKDEKTKCFKAGMNNYITKPVSGTVIKNVLKEYLLVSGADGNSDKDELRKRFDEVLLRESIGQDEELFRKLIDTVKNEFPSRVRLLKEAIAKGDIKEALNNAHALKGSCLSMQFGKLAEITMALEKMIKSDPDAESLNSLLKDLSIETETLVKIIRNI